MKKIFDGPEHIEDASVPWTDVFRDDFHVSVFYDKYPCTEGHLLFVPKYNTVEILKNAFEDAITYGQEKVQSAEWDGFNVGINYGPAAGQTVSWPHIHLIPRRNNDVEDPIGGIRNTIPGKGNYHKW